MPLCFAAFMHGSNGSSLTMTQLFHFTLEFIMKISVWMMICASAMWSSVLADTAGMDDSHQHLGGLRAAGDDRRELTEYCKVTTDCKYADASKCKTAKCSYNKCTYEECTTKAGSCYSKCENGVCIQEKCDKKPDDHCAYKCDSANKQCVPVVPCAPGDGYCKADCKSQAYKPYWYCAKTVPCKASDERYCRACSKYGTCTETKCKAQEGYCSATCVSGTCMQLNECKKSDEGTCRACGKDGTCTETECKAQEGYCSATCVSGTCMQLNECKKSDEGTCRACGKDGTCTETTCRHDNNHCSATCVTGECVQENLCSVEGTECNAQCVAGECKKETCQECCTCDNYQCKCNSCSLSTCDTVEDCCTPENKCVEVSCEGGSDSTDSIENTRVYNEQKYCKYKIKECSDNKTCHPLDGQCKAKVCLPIDGGYPS
jgi:hypothetical protein